MRHFASIFIISTTPFVIFLAIILYGGITPQLIKTQLSQSQIYEKLPQLLLDQGSSEVQSDPESQAFLTMITSNVDSAYIQAKTEKVIDETDAWIKGESDVPPVLSFRDIQEKVISDNPEFQEMVHMGASELEKNGGEAEPLNVMEQGNIPIGQNLKFLKDGYFAAKIALPVLFILLFIALILIVIKTHGLKSRLKYVGIVLVLTALLGYVQVFAGGILISQMMTVLSSQANSMVQLVAPIIMGLTDAIISRYNTVQTYVSIIMAVIGSLMVIGSFLVNESKGKKIGGAVRK